MDNVLPVGLVRQIDFACRICLPMEYRKLAGLDGSPIVVTTSNDGIVAKKAPEGMQCKYKIDNMGRIRLSTQFYRQFNWNSGDCVEIQMWRDGSLTIRKTDINELKKSVMSF